LFEVPRYIVEPLVPERTAIFAVGLAVPEYLKLMPLKSVMLVAPLTVRPRAEVPVTLVTPAGPTTVPASAAVVVVIAPVNVPPAVGNAPSAVRAAPAVVAPVPPLATAIVVPFQTPDVIVPTVAREDADVRELRVVTALVARPPDVFTALAIAVKTPVPVVTVEGATPAPPPTTIAFDVKTPDVAHVDALLKYGIPPDVPATVKAGVVVAVATEMMPPVKPTLVTVPAAAQVPSPRKYVVAEGVPDTGLVKLVAELMT